MSTRFNRVLRQPSSDVSDIGDLPASTARAGKLLGFDDDGNPVASTITLDDQDAFLDAVAETQAASASAIAAQTAAETAQAGAELARTSAETEAATANDRATDAEAARDAVGFRFVFDSSTTISEPDSGKLRFDNATVADVTTLAISATYNGGSDISDFIVRWDDSTHNPSAYLTIRKSGAPATFVELAIVGNIVDHTNWLEIPVAYVAGSGTLTNADVLYLSWQRNGDDGTGVGDVIGPNSVTDGSLARFDGTTGKLLKDGAVIGVDVLSPSGSGANLSGIIKQGIHAFNLPASNWVKQTTNGAATIASGETATNKVMTQSIAFDASTIEYYQSGFLAPPSADATANLAGTIEWTEASGASSHGVVWQIEAQAQGDGDTIDTAWGAAITATDTGSSGTRRFVSFTGLAVSNWSSTKRKVLIRLSRKATDSADTLNVDALFIEMQGLMTYNAADDS